MQENEQSLANLKSIEGQIEQLTDTPENKLNYEAINKKSKSNFFELQQIIELFNDAHNDIKKIRNDHQKLAIKKIASLTNDFSETSEDDLEAMKKEFTSMLQGEDKALAKEMLLKIAFIFLQKTLQFCQQDPNLLEAIISVHQSLLDRIKNEEPEMNSRKNLSYRYFQAYQEITKEVDNSAEQQNYKI